MFYREALKAILEQTETVEQFLNLSDNREKWVRYIASPSHPLGQVKDVPFSFNHPLVDAHFRFAFDILDILADINTVFQMKNSFVNYFWECLIVFHRYLVGELMKIEDGNFGRFTYLSSVRIEDRPQFLTILKSLILNMQVRFFRPSFSLDRLSIRDYLDYDRVCIRPEAPIVDCSRCGLTPLFELFNLRQTRQNVQNLGRLLGLSLDGEMMRLIPFLRSEQELITINADERMNGCSDLEKKVRLLLDFPTTTNLIDTLRTTGKRTFQSIMEIRCYGVDNNANNGGM